RPPPPLIWPRSLERLLTKRRAHDPRLLWSEERSRVSKRHKAKIRKRREHAIGHTGIHVRLQDGPLDAQEERRQHQRRAGVSAKADRQIRPPAAADREALEHADRHRGEARQGPPPAPTPHFLRR